jgi:histidyl-tRNA synthetase
VCITFDKLDKIGVSGVKEELIEKGFEEQCIAGLMGVLDNLPLTLDYVRTKVTDTTKIENIEKIIAAVNILSGGKFDISFDLSLVRGQGYYTGTVFEIVSKDFKGAIAGGGRYDNLIGKFIDESVPAVGFSIGFERIFSILKDNGFKIPKCREKIAVIYEDSEIIGASELREELCREYDVALFEKPKKLGRFLDALQNEGLYGFIIYGQSLEIKPFIV